MKSIFYYVSILSLLIVININGQGFLKADGRKIVNENGTPVLLRGMGLGGWMVPEGYMLQTSSFANSATEFRKKIASVIGEEETDKFFKLYRQNMVTKKDIQQLAEMGFNSIRLPMHYNLYTPKDKPFEYIDEGFELTDSLLAWCKEYQLYLILDLHAAPGGQSDENISDYIPGEPSLWESETNRLRTIDLWKKLATRYTNEEWIGGYDLINETKWNLPNNNKPLRDLYIAITNAIREIDKKHIIFIEGNWWANDFTGLTPPWDNNMVYSFHKYWNNNDLNSISGYLSMSAQHNIPLWLGESGENSNAWFTDAIELVEANNIGWCWWTFKKIGSVNSPWNVRKSEGYDNLLKYWSGTGSKPSVQAAITGLTQQAIYFNNDNCEFNEDMIDAMFRQVQTTELKPFRENKIPGILFGSDYDYGRYNIAYRDNDYQNVNSGTWNNGWVYRNDGIDLEKCSDAISSGYNISHIGTGEYVVHTIDVEQRGTYRISLRTSANKAGGKILLAIDGSNVGSTIDVPNSNGWQNWRTVTGPDVVLEAGKHTYQVRFFFDGYNFNYSQFDLISSVSEEELPLEFTLEQNYPNPFNPVTTINYQLPKQSKVMLKVFDVLGNEVMELENAAKDAGSYSINFDASRLASGIYFYRITAGGFTDVKKMILMK